MSVYPAEIETADDDEAVLRMQRDQARACAWLAAIIALALLLSNFGPESREMIQAREAVELHRKIKSQHEEIFRTNQAVLAQNQAELERVRAAVRGHP
jgi:hypothetical protein